MLEFKKLLQKIFLKNPNAPAFWLLLGLIFKGLLFISVLLNHPYSDIKGVWGAACGDDSSYIFPIDNLLLHGSYQPDHRMPGYGAVYLLFRFFLPQAGACNVLLLLQLILASASVYFLALTARNIFKKDSLFYLTFYLFLISTFSNFFDAYIASESLCASFLIFSIYFFTKYYRENKLKYLLCAGILATWAMFIRPAFGGVVTMCTFLILIQKGLEVKIKIKHAILFLLPFILLEGGWIYRNYEVHKKIVPFTSTGGAFYPGASASYLERLFNFTQSWGGFCSLNNTYVDADWFNYSYFGRPAPLHIDSLPGDIYTTAYNKDSLVILKRMIIALGNPALDTAKASYYIKELRTKFEIYRLSFKREKPFTYFLKAPLKIMSVMLIGPETHNYFDRGNSLPFLGKLRTYFNYFIYLSMLVIGLIGCVILSIDGLKKRSLLLIIPLIPLYTIVIHSFVLRLPFNRYLMPSYPFIIICSAYILAKLSERIIPFLQTQHSQEA